MKAKDLQEVLKDVDPEMDVCIRVYQDAKLQGGNLLLAGDYFEYNLDIYETDDSTTKQIVLVFDPNC